VDAPARALKPRLGLFEATVSGVGVILGAGIYALVGEAAGVAGGAVWISFLVAAAIAMITGLSYAELSSMYPRAGADYEYTRRGLGARTGFVVGWLMILSNLVGAAAVALAFGGYLARFVALDAVVLALGAVVACTLLAFVGVREAVRVAVILTFVEAAGLVFVICIGLPDVGDHALASGAGPSSLLSAAALVSFAFIGYGQVAALAEETRDAPRVIPRAIMLSILVTSVLYVLVAVAAVSAVGSARLAASDAPLAHVAAVAIGEAAEDGIAAVALLSTFNTVLLMLMASSRLLFGMASGDDPALPRFIAWIHPVVHTPARAIVICLVVAVGFTLSRDVGFAAGASNFAVFIAFIAVNVSLVVLRYRAPAMVRPFRVRGTVRGVPVLPVAAAATNLALLASLEREVLLTGGALFIVGLIAAELLRLWRPSAAA
jgi:APA family basic amino acid/polyamine antiporter